MFRQQEHRSAAKREASAFKLYLDSKGNKTKPI